VATSIGAEGIELGEAEGLYVRDSEAEFAETVIRLLESNARQRAGEIRQQVMSRYSFERSVETITATIRAFAGL
jgi:glycosyltransferase involved in cell wall biosynthesis